MPILRSATLRKPSFRNVGIYNLQFTILSEQAFAKTIIRHLKDDIGTDGMEYDNGVETTAMKAVADGITEYLLANTMVTISYIGTIPGTPPTPDPVTVDTFKITGQCAPTGTCSDFNAWLKQIEANIISGFMLAPTGNIGVAFPAKPWLAPGITTVRDTLKDIHTSNEDDPQIKVWTEICKDIIAWATGSGVNAVPGAATNSASGSVGTANITSITIN